jgi:hypothetical protein
MRSSFRRLAGGAERHHMNAQHLHCLEQRQ